MIQRIGPGTVHLKIAVKPYCKSNEITFIQEKAVARLNAKPLHGEANLLLLKVLSKALKVPLSDLSLLKGGKARIKTVQVQSTLSDTEILQKLSTKD